jgi:hypothetical protein
MPKVSNIFSSSFLRAADLDGPRDVTIAGWREEYLFGKNEYVLDLEGEDKFLRLNNPALARDIAAALGEENIDDWLGRVVTIYRTELKIRDKETGEEKLVNTIRAKKSDLDKPPPKKALKKPSDDDDIPF